MESTHTNSFSLMKAKNKLDREITYLTHLYNFNSFIMVGGGFGIAKLHLETVQGNQYRLLEALHRWYDQHFRSINLSQLAKFQEFYTKMGGYVPKSYRQTDPQYI